MSNTIQSLALHIIIHTHFLLFENMSMKTTKNMRGFMCQSQAATAVCMATTTSRSLVIVPRRAEKTLIDHNTRFSNNARYSRLVDAHRLAVGNKPFMKKEHDPHHQPKPIQKPSSSLASPDNVFQVRLRSSRKINFDITFLLDATHFVTSDH